MKNFTFKKARPVWIAGEEKEMNVSLFMTAKCGKDARLDITGHSVYQVFVNGRLAADGPARAGHGFYRVDELELGPLCDKDENEIKIIIAGYNVNSFYLIDMPSFVCAELYDDGKITAFTGGEGFTYERYTDRVRKVQRYSFQRPFAEAYSLPAQRQPVTVSLTENKRFIERGVQYPDYDFTAFSRVVAAGGFEKKEPEQYFSDRAIRNISDKLKGFTQDELDVFISRETEKFNCALCPCDKPTGKTELDKNTYAIFDLSAELTGFIEFEIETSGGRLCVSFDEILRGGDVSFTRLGTCSAIIYDLKPGKYKLISFEPYSLRYAKFCSDADHAVITAAGLRRFEYPAKNIRKAPDFSDEALDRVYKAAVSTFRQNTVDIYMDCPSRERAGWLCDSFFTSRTEYALTGRSTVEKNFLENFIMPEKFDFIPDGMLPMCYPSDHNDHTYIPNWAMWYVVELEEYLTRTGDTELIADAKARVYGLLDFFRGFENGDGLLEKLQSWVFVEWSKSNELTQDINYPTNMLYYKFKKAIADIYGDKALSGEADKLADKIREKSYTGQWFCDNSVYVDGKAVLTGECTESCQYYAFFTGVATKELYPQLWDTLVSDFGPDRKKNNKYPKIYFANAFIGNYLRLELLFREGLYDELLDNVRGYLDYMAQKTGTLWENDGDYASCNHGFASHVAVWLLAIYGKDVL
ncbi:MAG: hypothetical protein IJT49_00915 [Clostridia bacterium]|nr:hypothetical protein [Clostridia bacterium]